MIRFHKVSIFFISYFAMNLFFSFTCMQATPDSYTEADDNEQVGMEKKVQSALNEIKKFNFTVLKKTDPEIKFLHEALASIFLDGSLAHQLIKEWNDFDPRHKKDFDWHVDIFEIEEEFLVVLDFLEEIIDEEIEQSEEPEENPRIVLALELVDLIKNLKDKYFPESYRVDEALESIKKFNFIALKRNEKKLQEVYNKLVDFFRRKGMLQDSCICNLSCEAVNTQIKNWDTTKRYFQKNRSVRIRLKVSLFNALEFFEKIVENFKFEEELLLLIKSTREHMAQRLCA